MCWGVTIYLCIDGTKENEKWTIDKVGSKKYTIELHGVSKSKFILLSISLDIHLFLYLFPQSLLDFHIDPLLLSELSRR